MYAIKPICAANGGVTTATNATTGSASAKIAVMGQEVIISVGAAAPLNFRFGAESDTVTTANGLMVPASGMIRVSVPGGATHLHHIRSAATDTTISVQFCDGGI
jgi:hypothetical protein